MFKVVPDQLRISEGWVRCGQCGEIFNASQHLMAGQQSAAPAPVPSTATPAGPDPAPAPAMFAPVVPAHAPVTAPAPAPHPVVVDTGARGAAIEPAYGARPPAASTRHEPGWSEPVDVDLAATPVADAPPAPANAAPLPSSGAFGPAPNSPERAPTPQPDVSFLRPRSSDSVWERRPMRVVLVLLVLLLAAALVAQVLVHERNRIVLLEPSTRPALLALCALARCELGPLRQIESVVIESSSFGRLGGDNFRLGFSLRNTAPVAIAMPAIELSMTDAQDQAVVRRVILPGEFGAAAATLAAESDWSGNLALRVRPATNTERIAGYRLLAFYP